jgi:hypothetical protein
MRYKRENRYGRGRDRERDISDMGEKRKMRKGERRDNIGKRRGGEQREMIEYTGKKDRGLRDK